MNTTTANTAITPHDTTTGAHAPVLVDPAWLAAHLTDPNVCVVEVDVSAAAYDEWHIDGAVLWNIYGDLKDAEYQLADAATIEQLFARSGIEPGTTVVFYGYGPAFGFWLAQLYGHTDARILDCSRETWRAEGRPWSTTTTPAAEGTVRSTQTRADIRADHRDVRDAIDRAGTQLLDVRSTAEYTGERFWPSGGMEPNGRAGHVPSAAHQPIDGLYDDRGAFRSPAELRRVFSSVALDDDREDIITYCTIGSRAATAWFVLTYLLGRPRVRVYDGSWADWGRRPDTPVES